MTDLPAVPSAAAAAAPAITAAPPSLDDAPAFVRILRRSATGLEHTLTVYGAALLIALLLLAVAAVYVTPALVPINHGVDYAGLSVRPFDFAAGHYLQLRILTPALGHWLHLRGPLFPILPLAMDVFLLAAVYTYFRKQHFDPAEATGMAALLAFSTPVLSQLHFAGYIDPTSHLLIFLMLISARYLWLWPILFSLAMLNHGSNILVGPLVVCTAIAYRPRWTTLLLAGAAAALAVVPAAAYSAYVQAHAEIPLSESHYLNADHIKECIWYSGRCMYLGIFLAFKLFWFFPLAAVALLAQRGSLTRAGWLVLAVACALAQLLFATDTSRLVGLAFPAILFGAAACREAWGTSRFVRRLWLLVGLNFFVPQYYIGQTTAIPYFPLPLSFLLRHVFNLDAWDLCWRT